MSALSLYADDLEVAPGLLPPAPPDWHAATLPPNYDRARRALARCDRVDLCLAWRNKAAAFASYYRQARDKTLMELAQRIRLRAIRRLGELLPGDASPEIDRQMLPSQQVQARRLARIPEAEFETAIQASPVPSESTLAALSRDRYGVPRPNMRASVRGYQLPPPPTAEDYARDILGALDAIDRAQRRALARGIGLDALVACLRVKRPVRRDGAPSLYARERRMLFASVADFLAACLADRNDDGR